MVAASIQSLASGLHGAPTPADRTTASSQGGFTGPMDALWYGSDSGRRL